MCGFCVRTTGLGLVATGAGAVARRGLGRGATFVGRGAGADGFVADRTGVARAARAGRVCTGVGCRLGGFEALARLVARARDGADAGLGLATEMPATSAAVWATSTAMLSEPWLVGRLALARSRRAFSLSSTRFSSHGSASTVRLPLVEKAERQFGHVIDASVHPIAAKTVPSTLARQHVFRQSMDVLA